MSSVLSILIDLMFLYFGIGLVFGIWFIIAGAPKLDEGAKGTPWHFRLILLPGSILIWSVLLYKLVTRKS
jgi:hypothetical protein